jgi:hypothetical protein
MAECPSAGRVHDLLQAAIAARKFGDDYFEIEDLLVITPFRWPALEEWRSIFQAMNFEPRNWFYPASYLAFKEQPRELALIGESTAADRKLMMEGCHAMRASSFLDRYKGACWERLTISGNLQRLVSAKEKIKHIPLAQLRGIQKDLSIRGGASRADVAEQLCSSASEEELAALLPAEYSEEMVVVNPARGLPNQQWFRERRMLAKSYLVTVISCLSSLRTAEGAGRLGVGLMVLGGASDCPVCSPLQGQASRAGDGTLPPFHPACLCHVLADVKWPRPGGAALQAEGGGEGQSEVP